MKIQSSAVAMKSQREYKKYAQEYKASMITTAEDAATLDFSKEGISMVEQMKEEQERLQQEKEERRKENEGKLFSDMLQKTEHTDEVPRENPMQLKLELLKKMIKALNQMRGGNSSQSLMEMKQLKSQYQAEASFMEKRGIVLKGSGMNISGSGGNATKWTKTTVTSAFVTETEHTAYQAAGLVKTADGREINFGVTLEMSRAFCAKYDSIVQEDYICTDPLVINLDTNVATVTDQKFLFDLDADGKEERISFVGQGSGFLALDKNKDGKINDGSELFGTRSGDGFKDLAAYDQDKNGWIDENDSVFNDLKIWTKDEQGNDRLIGLKEAGVGAIYLGNASTEFALKDNASKTANGVIRKTGIYLKESGEVSTLQHVDLVI